MKLPIITLMMLLAQWTTAQNLVPNPDFEITNGDFCGLMVPGDYAATTVDWYAPTQGTPDLYFTTNAQSCYNFQPNSTYSGQIGFKGTQLPRSGSVMTGLGLYTIQGYEQREYIQVPLNYSLLVGEKYVVECYVSVADYMEFYSDQFGMYLSVQAVSHQTDYVLNYTPQVSSGGMISDTQNWVRIADTIIATDAFAYLTIGSFSSDEQTNTAVNPSASGDIGTYGSYYFIDDVRIEHIADTTHGSVGILELTATEKTLVKIVDFMGRETEFKPNTPLIYIYSDGTRERVLKFEK